ncbi:MAG TPA: efflux RND transporter permease subunit [Verrucomicrobiae bacterium]|nr:efflux RND transporter permease subunit [Verrucomicrobiae bacterium]
MNGINLSEWAIRHKSLAIYFMLMSVVAGVSAYRHLGRNEDPEFTVKTMVVQTLWPGATQEETVQQVTDRIEKKLQDTPNLYYLKSYTIAGQSTVFVYLLESTPKQDVPDLWYQVRKKVGDIRQTLPQGVVGPFFNDEFGDTYGIIYGFTADGFSHRELRDYAEEARSRLLRVKDVAKAEFLGTQDERIYIEFSTHRLAELGMDRMELVQALVSQNAVVPSGVIQTKNEAVLVDVTGRFESEKDLRQVNFSFGGKMLRLGDIATITRGYADPPQPIFRVNGKDAIGVALSMRAGGDILALEKDLDEAIEEFKADLPVGIETSLVSNQPKVVHQAVHEFTKSLWEAIAIVLAISFVSLGLRAGMVVATSIPLVLAIVFVTLQAFGIDLQRISLGALIIALGLLVDDAMITIESMVSKLEEGWDTVRAATFAYTSTAFPMLTGTLVTMLGFVPIGFAKSSAGEYTFSLFAVVVLALLVSWFVAVIFSPLIGTMILSPKHKGKREERGSVMTLFRRVLLFTMGHSKMTLALTALIFCVSLGLAPFVPSQFFPSSDRPELIVDLRLRHDASIYATDRASQKLDEVLRGDANIVHWSSYVGRGAIRFYLPLDVQLQNDFFTQTVIVTKSLEAREQVRKRLEAALQQEFPEAVGRVFPLELGPPVGWPVQYRVSGPDPHKVREIADKVARIIGASSDLRNVNFNWMDPIRKLRIRVNQDEARQLGLTSATVAQAINAVVSGIPATKVRDSIYLIDVVVRAQGAERMSLETIRALKIPLPNGQSAPLTELASVDYEQDLPLIWRRDRQPTLTVQAEVKDGVMPATAVARLSERVSELKRQLPAGYKIVEGGSVEESTKGQASVVAVFPVMIILMMTVLMIQMQRFSHLFLVCSVAPLGVIGVVLALLATQKPMGFVALLGVVALIGMIVRNSVILVHQIDVEREAGRSDWDAVVEATVLRFRPIMLTAVAAILGMAPIAPTVFWGPMAYAIMGGLAVATVLTLISLPSLYINWFKIREQKTPS